MSDAEGKGAQDSRNSLCVVGAEALFVVLPFVVTGLALFEKGEFSKLFGMPAWSAAASTLIGLSLVRFATGLLQGRARDEGLAWERVMLMFAAVIVFALMPSLLVLSLTLRAGEPSALLAFAQIGFFGLGMFLFLSLGWMAQRLLSAEEAGQEKPELTVINTARAAGD